MERPLQEREREIAVLAAAVEGAEAGGALVVVEGPPGIGKTRLVEAAREQAQRRDMLVLDARASELESGVPFGIVRQLFEPVVRGAGPGLLEGAAALARPLFSPEPLPEPAQEDAFPRLHGLYWLLHDLAAERPAVVLVDDGQWADRPSLHFLAFLAPRARDLQAAVVVATRPVATAREPLLARLATDANARVLRPEELSSDAIADLAEAVLGVQPHPAFVAACAESTGGNPFFASELLREAERRGLGGGSEAAAALRTLAPQGVAAMVMLRLADSPVARALAEAVAVLGPGAALADAGALAGIGAGEAREAAGMLARAGVLADRSQLAFVHPVVGSAVLATMGAVARAEAHAAAARLLRGRGAPDEDVVAQLLSAGPSGDAATVAILRASARRALTLGVPGSAVLMLQRALAEPPAPPEEPALLLELGRAAAAAGDPSALEHLRRAVERAPGPVERARGAIELGQSAKYGGGAAEAAAVLERCLAETTDPELAERLEVELLSLAHVSASTRELLAPRLAALERPPERATGWRAAAAWTELAFRCGAEGGPAAEGADLAAHVPAALGGRTEQPADWILLATTAACTWIEAFDLAERFADLVLADARRRGTALPLSGAASLRAWLNLRRGRVRDAEADAAFALSMAEEITGTDVLVTLARSTRALVEIDRGTPPEQLRVRLAELEGDRPDSLPFQTILHARGCVRLALGDHSGALDELREAGRRNDAWAPGPSVINWRGPAAVALHRLGDADGARRLAEEDIALARRAGLRRALGMALRTAALVSDGNRMALLDEAVDVLADGPDPLEHARALTDLGSELRRARRPTEAREPLRLAVDQALRGGADAVARRARDELLATGARPRRMALSGAEALTAAERRVAELAAAGRSNREIAEQLFVTQKTVEGHLRGAYDKLGIRSRHALAEALPESPG